METLGKPYPLQAPSPQALDPARIKEMMASKGVPLPPLDLQRSLNTEQHYSWKL